MIKSLILIALGGSLFFLAMRRLRRYRLKERYALAFVLLGVPFFGLAIYPGAVGWIGEQTGIHYVTITLLCVTAFFIFAIFELLTIVSVQDQKINALSQLVGILMEKQKLVEPEHAPRWQMTGDAGSPGE